ncbi:unnamed protein product [Ilex paraguariensis]|uniref:Nop domain-containing protein n=1 Tax=Ilex paraguariensis TaxID=185542 RepID=A0ABC8UN37_9AQUA
MALLADTFFSDFDELLDNEADIFDEYNFDVDNMEEDDEEMMGMASVVAVMFLNMTNSVYRAFKLKEENEADILDEDNLDVEIMEEDADGDLADIEALNYDDLHSVSNLQKTLHYVDIMQDEDNLDVENMEEDADGDLADIEALNYDDLDSVSNLQKTLHYADIMQKVEDALENGAEISNQGIASDGDREYQLIVDCNALSVDIENEIGVIHNFIRDKYRLKFPELESQVQHPIDYSRVVKKIGNEVDLTLVDLEALALVLAKKKVLVFLESRMGDIAPNLSVLVGSAVAAKLMGIAGGLPALANIPADNVEHLGAKRKNLAGFSSATSQFRVGYLEQTEIFQSTPPSLRICVDCIRGDPTGKKGRDYRDQIHKMIEKWQEPPPAKQPKALPVPDTQPKKRRGGHRLRKMKERYAITKMRKPANRMQFGVPEESSLGNGLGEGYGMLGQAGSGKLHVTAEQSKLAAKVMKKFKVKHYGSSGATSGLTSSLAFTPVQGIELSNPLAHAHQLGSGTQSTYFSETGTFSRIKRT